MLVILSWGYSQVIWISWFKSLWIGMSCLCVEMEYISYRLDIKKGMNGRGIRVVGILYSFSESLKKNAKEKKIKSESFSKSSWKGQMWKRMPRQQMVSWVPRQLSNKWRPVIGYTSARANKSETATWKATHGRGQVSFGGEVGTSRRGY